ncbi:MAG: hypothetical protein SFX73_04265 [Kofleriaceae bacterium]|nr:hypothetical protein [Kofleriaceae bacterium]
MSVRLEGAGVKSPSMQPGYWAGSVEGPSHEQVLVHLGDVREVGYLIDESAG